MGVCGKARFFVPGHQSVRICDAVSIMEGGCLTGPSCAPDAWTDHLVFTAREGVGAGSWAECWI